MAEVERQEDVVHQVQLQEHDDQLIQEVVVELFGRQVETVDQE